MFREATLDDLIALRDLERTANLAGLGHVFPPDRFPFPDDDVLARWALVLDEPGVDVLVRDTADGSGIDLFAAYDDRSLRHLAVHPDHWGDGLATTAIETVLHAMDDAGYDDRGAVVPGGEPPGPPALRVPRLARHLRPSRGALAAAPDGDALHPADPPVGPVGGRVPGPGIAAGSAQGRWVLAAAVLGSGMALLDGTVVNIALRSVGEDLGASIASSSGWSTPTCSRSRR